MGLHTKALSKSCFYHIRSFRQIRSWLLLLRLHLFRRAWIRWISFYGTAVKHTGRLQRVQHALARVMVNQRSRLPFSYNELLKQFHWLPLEWRIQFKLATLIFKALHTGRPPYRTDLLQHTISPYKVFIRSSSSHQLFIPRHNLSFGFRAFRFSAYTDLDKLPLHIRETQSLPALNAILRLTFPVSLPHPLAIHHPTRPDSSIDFGAI